MNQKQIDKLKIEFLREAVRIHKAYSPDFNSIRIEKTEAAREGIIVFIRIPGYAIRETLTIASNSLPDFLEIGKEIPLGSLIPEKHYINDIIRKGLVNLLKNGIIEKPKYFSIQFDAEKIQVYLEMDDSGDKYHDAGEYGEENLKKIKETFIPDCHYQLEEMPGIDLSNVNPHKDTEKQHEDKPIIDISEEKSPGMKSNNAGYNPYLKLFEDDKLFNSNRIGIKEDILKVNKMIKEIACDLQVLGESDHMDNYASFQIGLHTGKLVNTYNEMYNKYDPKKHNKKEDK